MYPKEIFLGLDLYAICMCVGIFLCILAFSLLADRIKIRAKLQKFCFVCAIFAIPLGYFSSVLFQALYNIKERAGFVMSSSTGTTFYGGLIGGAAVFLAIYFIAGHFMFPDGYHESQFFRMSSCAAISITLAHGFGRIGCLMAGCCHGKATEAWYGIVMNGGKYVPVQLFEAIFLFLLCGIMIFLLLKGKTLNLPLYLISYGIWRFFIEYARGDYRGDTFVSFLSPSQLTAVVLAACGVGLLIFERIYTKKHSERNECVFGRNETGE